MKKFLLFGAAAMMACAANAQSITEVWSATAAATASVDNNVRYATGYGNKIYLNEVGSGKVSEWENGVKTNEWAINDFLVEAGQTYETTDAETGEVKVNNFTMWHPITTDDAGNVLVGGCYGPNVATLGSKWVLIPADGSGMQVVDLEFSDAALQNRIDCIGRVVGDLTADAYIPMAPNASTNLVIMNVYADEEAGKIVSFNDASIVIPTALTPDTQTVLALNADYDFFAEGPSVEVAGPVAFERKRGNAELYGWDAGVAALNSMLNADGAKIGSDGCTLTGFDVFTIGETTYYVVPFKNGLASANHRSTSFQVRNMADGSVVAEYNTMATTDNAYGAFFARVNEDGTATIYAFNQADRAGVYTFDPNGTPSQSGVEETLANDNAPVEYYNLQGVKVANPENGIFVKKQAGKATKVVL